MRVFKWLKRDRSDRRKSDSHVAMVVSADSDFQSTKSKSDRSDDPIRTDEYKKALTDFFARRSLGPNSTVGVDTGDFAPAKTPEKNGRFGRKTQSEKKPKRCSLPRTESQDVPQIQFLFSNQIFMPGSGMSFLKGRKKEQEGSLISTSPDLLPPKFLRNKNVDFDANDDNPSSPPDDFFRENSLPYQDVKPTPKPDEDVVDTKTPTSDDSFVSDQTDVSFGSMARKLEQMCKYTSSRGRRSHFRGIPLVKMDALDYHEDPLNKKWFRAKWKRVPVAVKKNPKTWCTPGGTVSLDHFVAQDLDVLTKIRHPNILLLMGICCNKSSYVQSFYEECISSLHDFVHEQKNTLSLQMSLQYLNGIANALMYLKINNYVHTSVSSQTIMLTSKGTAKLCNFELCCQIVTNNKKKRKGQPNKLDFLSEPSYENLKDLNTDSSFFDDEFIDQKPVSAECAPQEVSLRSIFAPFRWQSPELFDDYGGLVYPSLKTDVYSLILVLWECCNGSIPWKSISYEQLCEIYFHWKRGIKIPTDIYPKTISNILIKCLSLDPDERMSIEDLCESFNDAMENLSTLEDIYISNKETQNNPEDEIKKNICKAQFQHIKKIEVTNLDNSNDSCTANKIEVFLNSYLSHADAEKQIEPVVEHSNSLDELQKHSYCEDDQDNLFHGSNSTEYQSLMTPAITRFSSQIMNTSINAKQISFDEDCPSERNDDAVVNKIVKLNTICTPKSYKSLEIESPPEEKLNYIRTFTRSFEIKSSEPNKSTYSFEIQNTSLPNTPIARNTKIRRNAWLSGEDKIQTEAKHQELSLHLNNSMTEIGLSKESLSEKCTDEPNKNNLGFKHSEERSNIFDKMVKRGKRRHSLVNIKCNSLLSSLNNSNDACSFRTDNSQLNINIEPSGTYRRCRSQSLSSKPTTYPKSVEDITGVDIKPLVAIHEKWILEANNKHGQLVTTPENYRGSLHAVKPASHLIDPLRPKNNGSLHSFDLETSKKKDLPKLGHYADVSPMIRSSIFKKRIINSKPADFFENSLWQKEKEICLSQKGSKNNPQGSSTPCSKNVLIIDHTSADKCTNTDSFEDLCKKILDGNKYNTYTITPKKFSKKQNTVGSENNLKNSNPDTNDPDYKRAKLSVLSELSNTFERNEKLFSHHADKIRCEDVNVTVAIGSSEEIFLSVTENNNSIIHQPNKDNPLEVCRNCNSPDCEEDCVSLPDLNSQTDEIENKALKRCQAFSALQDARSTEDMYIDDELTAHMEIQNMSENMKLVPLDGTLHEALCEKGDDCCLLRMQDEAGCNRILLFCENKRERRKMSNDSISSSESEYSKETQINHHPMLQIENQPSIDLIDFAPGLNLLPIIEERSGEEDNAEADNLETSKGVQDLIHLYEKENNDIREKTKTYKIVKNKESVNKKLTYENPKKEISIFILDNGDNMKENCNSQIDILSLNSVIDDVVHV